MYATLLFIVCNFLYKIKLFKSFRTLLSHWHNLEMIYLSYFYFQIQCICNFFYIVNNLCNFIFGVLANDEGMHYWCSYHKIIILCFVTKIKIKTSQPGFAFSEQYFFIYFHNSPDYIAFWYFNMHFKSYYVWLLYKIYIYF